MCEAFPGSFNAIRDAFELSDPATQLLELIQTHPERVTVGDIVVICLELLEQSPSKINKLAGSLATLKSSTITVTSYHTGKRERLLIGVALDCELRELLEDELATVDNGSVTPSNRYLIASLLSAATVKFSLCSSYAKSSTNEIDRGVCYHQDSIHPNPPHEIFVLGACLQLCMSGPDLCGPEGFDDRRLLSALERIKEAGIVTHPNGQQLLEFTIQQARDGFKNYVDGWSILFP